MKCIKVLIIDDEPQAVKRIERLLKADPVFEITGSCQNSAEARKMIENYRIDLLFLDIEMPGETGIELITSLPPFTRPRVVFVTAYDDYAVMAFEYFALDYVLKPFSNERFRKTLERIKCEFLNQDNNRDWDLISSFMHNKELPKDRFVVKTGKKYRFIDFQEINYILANGAYATLVTHKGQRILYRETLTNLYRQLSPLGFIRIHHGAVIYASNIKGVNRLSYGDLEVVMNDGEHIRVSRAYKKIIKQLLHKKDYKQ